MLVTRKSAKSLAVRYHAYLTAENDFDRIVWGEMLLKAQCATGIEMLDPENVRSRVERAKRNRGEN